MKAAMASGLSGFVVLALCVCFAPCVSAGSKDCEAYRDIGDVYQSSQKCRIGFCCGSCLNRYCCQDSFWRLTEEKQEDCAYSFVDYSSSVPTIIGVGFSVAVGLIVICCCVCPCCILYKTCRKTRPVIATTTTATVVSSTPRPYPQQQTTATGPPQAYQSAQYQPYQPMPVQPGYGTQPMPQGYGPQPTGPSPYPGQSFTPGPPPTYQEATGPGYPPQPMPYSQAAFSPGQPSYPLQPPGKQSYPQQPPDQPSYPQQPPFQPQPNVPARTDYLSQPAYNPDYVAPPQ